ncbi:hypothetical protein V1511DRAFT_490577 [Dipodascopsis uninucleata]
MSKKRRQSASSSSSEESAQLAAVSIDLDELPTPTQIPRMDRAEDAINPTKDQDHVVECSLPPTCNNRPSHFYSTLEFEKHYASNHSLSCFACGKIFPVQRLLDLHFTEVHDPFVYLRRERGDKTFACFVEGCDKLCRTPKTRRLHLIDKHAYPKDYLFSIVTSGIRPGQTSLLKQHG